MRMQKNQGHKLKIHHPKAQRFEYSRCKNLKSIFCVLQTRESEMTRVNGITLCLVTEVMVMMGLSGHRWFGYLT